MKEISQRPVAIVTGGTGGIGFASALSLTAEGYHVVLADIHAPNLPGDREIGSDMTYVRADVTSTESVRNMVSDVIGRHGRIDALVNNAGHAERIPAEELRDENILKMLDVHLVGALRCARECFEALSSSSTASIVNISSIGGRVGRPRRAHYAAAKAGIEGATRTLAVEWASQGIRVNAVAPGHCRTRFVDEASRAGEFDETQANARIPLGRIAETSEVADVITFMVSPRSRFITGQTVVVDGGMTIDGRFGVDP